MSRGRRTALWMVRVFISLLLGALILLRVGPSRILDAVGGTAALPLVLALLLGAPRFGVKLIRWKLLASRAATSISWRQSATSLLVGTAGAVITPGRVGQAASALAINQGSRLALSGLALVDPLSDLLMVAIIAIFVTAGIPWGIGAALLGIIAIRASSRLGERLEGREGKIGYISAALRLLDERTLLLVAGLSLINYGFNLIQFHFLLGSHGPIPFAVSAETLPLIFLAIALPITIAGLGVREAAAALVLSGYGIDPGIAVQASFLLFVINVLIPGLLGAVIAGRLGLRLRDLAPKKK